MLILSISHQRTSYAYVESPQAIDYSVIYDSMCFIFISVRVPFSSCSATAFDLMSSFILSRYKSRLIVLYCI